MTLQLLSHHYRYPAITIKETVSIYIGESNLGNSGYCHTSNVFPRFIPSIVTFVPPSQGPDVGWKDRISGFGQVWFLLNQTPIPLSHCSLTWHRLELWHQPQPYFSPMARHIPQLSAIAGHRYTSTKIATRFVHNTSTIPWIKKVKWSTHCVYCLGYLMIWSPHLPRQLQKEL